jgi:hypothetical protein
MIAFLLWCILLLLCWPIALLALFLSAGVAAATAFPSGGCCRGRRAGAGLGGGDTAGASDPASGIVSSARRPTTMGRCLISPV